MVRTNIYLDEAQIAALEAASRDLGVSRAELVRRLIDSGLGTPQPAGLEADLEAIERSFGVGGASTAPPRQPDERARHLERVRRGS